MSKDELTRIRHALDAARQARTYVGATTPDEFAGNEMLALATIRLLEAVGEALSQIDSRWRDAHPQTRGKMRLGSETS